MMKPPGMHPTPQRYCTRGDHAVATTDFIDIRDAQGTIYSGCATCLRAAVAQTAEHRGASDLALLSVLRQAELALTTPQDYRAIDRLVADLQAAQRLLSAPGKG